MFNPDDFRNTKDDLIKIIARDINKGKSLIESVTTLGQAYGVPLVCIYTYVMEEMPEHTVTCKMKIQQLNDYMGVKNKDWHNFKNMRQWLKKKTKEITWQTENSKQFIKILLFMVIKVQIMLMLVREFLTVYFQLKEI